MAFMFLNASNIVTHRYAGAQTYNNLLLRPRALSCCSLFNKTSFYTGGTTVAAGTILRCMRNESCWNI